MGRRRRRRANRAPRRLCRLRCWAHAPTGRRAPGLGRRGPAARRLRRRSPWRLSRRAPRRSAGRSALDQRPNRPGPRRATRGRHERCAGACGGKGEARGDRGRGRGGGWGGGRGGGRGGGHGSGWRVNDTGCRRGGGAEQQEAVARAEKAGREALGASETRLRVWRECRVARKSRGNTTLQTRARDLI